MGEISETFKPKKGFSLLNARIRYSSQYLKSFMQKSSWILLFSPYIIMLCATYIVLCINLIVYLPIGIIIMGWEDASDLFLEEIKHAKDLFKDVI